MSRVVADLIFALEGLFALGVAGSFLVLILTLIEDSKELFQKEKGPAELIAALPPTQVQPTLPH